MFHLWRFGRVVIPFAFIICLVCIGLLNIRNVTSKTYQERRKAPSENELAMTELSRNSEKNDIWEYVNEGYEIAIDIPDSQSETATLSVNGNTYEFSYEAYTPLSEKPEICLWDVNEDGLLDILLRGEAYKNQLRQGVYLSNSDGTFNALGDVTWGSKLCNKDSFSFSAHYEDGYKIHIEIPAWNINMTEKIHSEDFLDMVEELGIYDEKGNVTDYGKRTYVLNNLQGQAVRYLQTEDGDILLKYEAQLEADYSEYCLGWCFAFLYAITEDGYILQEVSVERFDY